MRPGTGYLVGGAFLALAGSANAAEPKSCEAVRFSDVGWTDITATTALTSVILEGLGYEPSATVLAVPSYLAEEGLKDFADIAKFKDKLDGKIYGIEPGNDGNRLIQKMIDEGAFGLKGFEVVESSEQGMLAQVE